MQPENFVEMSIGLIDNLFLNKKCPRLWAFKKARFCLTTVAIILWQKTKPSDLRLFAWQAVAPGLGKLLIARVSAASPTQFNKETSVGQSGVPHASISMGVLKLNPLASVSNTNREKYAVKKKQKMSNHLDKQII